MINSVPTTTQLTLQMTLSDVDAAPSHSLPLNAEDRVKAGLWLEETFDVKPRVGSWENLSSLDLRSNSDGQNLEQSNSPKSRNLGETESFVHLLVAGFSSSAAIKLTENYSIASLGHNSQDKKLVDKASELLKGIFGAPGYFLEKRPQQAVEVLDCAAAMESATEKNTEMVRALKRYGANPNRYESMRDIVNNHKNYDSLDSLISAIANVDPPKKSSSSFCDNIYFSTMGNRPFLLAKLEGLSQDQWDSFAYWSEMYKDTVSLTAARTYHNADPERFGR